MNVEHRTSNECILSIIKRQRTALPSFEIRYSIFDTAESFDPESLDPELTTEGLVAGCGSLFNPAAEAARLIIKKPCHFGVVSYKVSVSKIAFPDT